MSFVCIYFIFNLKQAKTNFEANRFIWLLNGKLIEKNMFIYTVTNGIVGQMREKFSVRILVR